MPGPTAVRHRPVPSLPPTPPPTTGAPAGSHTNAAAVRGEARPAAPPVRDHVASGAPARPTPTNALACHDIAARTRDRLVTRAMDALVRDGADGLGELVREDRQVLSSLGRMSADGLAARIDGALSRSRRGVMDRLGGNYFLRQTAVGRVEARVGQVVRELIRSEALGAVDAVIDEIGRTDTAMLARGLASAEAGTEAHALAARLGLSGTGEQTEHQVRDALTDIVSSLREFRAHIYGGTWEPSDFPRSTQRVMCRLGVSEVPEGSILAGAIEGDRDTTEALHKGQSALEGAHLLYEIAHFANHPELLTGGPLAIGIAGTAFGFAVHHAVQENIAERREFAAQMGL